ncbi:hypothetical protein GPJ56_009282 [Histomonas meleagridis]|uniref:uncharacterized protein n=1 Tax=Histomonas meleagridis TaxID=135588 RepID=UPI003559C4E2|nr:hypothetical protein GPJ56_009282 [Histomonas meleagridis]KAH0797695.1 hypothetical protein GO595_009324 [Histomonas meleagridis]
MYRSSILFVPLPPARPYSYDINSLSSIAGPRACELSKEIRNNPNENNYQEYIQILYTKLGTRFQSAWSNPFNANDVIQSTTIETEILNTIWNFLSLIHRRILSLDIDKHDDLRSIRYLISDSHSCVSNFISIVTKIQHPIFNESFVKFLQSYHCYLDSIWKYSIVLFSKETKLYAKTCHLCLKEMHDCFTLTQFLHPVARPFLSSVCKSLEIILQSKIRYDAGNEFVKNHEIGKAISSFQTGIYSLSQPRTPGPSLSMIDTAISIIKNTLEMALAQARAENKRIYNQSVPREPPLLPNPCQHTQIEPNVQLLLDQTNVSFHPNLGSSAVFPQWNNVMRMKGNIKRKMNEMMSRVNLKQKCNELNEQMKMAESSDEVVANAIRHFGIVKGLQRNAIEALIQQALEFYGDMGKRLDVLAATGN